MLLYLPQDGEFLTHALECGRVDIRELLYEDMAESPQFLEATGEPPNDLPEVFPTLAGL